MASRPASLKLDGLRAALLLRRVDDPNRRATALRLRLRAAHRQRRADGAASGDERDRIVDGAHPRPGRTAAAQPDVPGQGTRPRPRARPDGVTPAVNVQVALLPGAVSSRRGFETRTNALGEFSFADAPVGVFTLSAADTTGAFGQTSGVLAGGGQTAELDVVLTARADDGGRLVGRVFLSDGVDAGRRLHGVRRQLQPRHGPARSDRPHDRRRHRHLRVRAHAAAGRL